MVDVKYPEEEKPIRGESQIDGIYQEILIYLNNNFDLKQKENFLSKKCLLLSPDISLPKFLIIQNILIYFF